MTSIQGAGLSQVQAVYMGPEGKPWELAMGEQIHIDGFGSSMTLADRAGIGEGMAGVDLCCCTGAGLRFLVRFRGVRSMMGVDATEAMVEMGRRRTAAEGLSERISFTLADACASRLPDRCADFVWGEDAWCYVVDKEKLIAEAVEEELGIAVVEIEVPPVSDGMRASLRTRLEAVVETVLGRRRMDGAPGRARRGRE
jgi:trans-aconitate methyltransferase